MLYCRETPVPKETPDPMAPKGTQERREKLDSLAHQETEYASIARSASGDEMIIIVNLSSGIKILRMLIGWFNDCFTCYDLQGPNGPPGVNGGPGPNGQKVCRHVWIRSLGPIIIVAILP